MSIKYSAFFIFIYFSLICSGQSGEILDKIKGGLDTAYDEVHCGFHKLKELVKHHEHDIDPCTGKSSTTTASPQEIEGNTETSGTYNYRREPTENSYGWRV